MVGETELLLGGRTVVGTDNSRTYFEFTSFPPWLAAFLAIARLDWLDIVGGGNLIMRKVCDAEIGRGLGVLKLETGQNQDWQIFLRFKS